MDIFFRAILNALQFAVGSVPGHALTQDFNGIGSISSYRYKFPGGLRYTQQHNEFVQFLTEEDKKWIRDNCSEPPENNPPQGEDDLSVKPGTLRVNEIYNCTRCTGIEDIVFQTPILEGDGVCLFGKCQSRTALRGHWERTLQLLIPVILPSISEVLRHWNDKYVKSDGAGGVVSGERELWAWFQDPYRRGLPNNQLGKDMFATVFSPYERVPYEERLYNECTNNTNVPEMYVTPAVDNINVNVTAGLNVPPEDELILVGPHPPLLYYRDLNTSDFRYIAPNVYGGDNELIFNKIPKTWTLRTLHHGYNIIYNYIGPLGEYDPYSDNNITPSTGPVGKYTKSYSPDFTNPDEDANPCDVKPPVGYCGNTVDDVGFPVYSTIVSNLQSGSHVYINFSFEDGSLMPSPSLLYVRLLHVRQGTNPNPFPENPGEVATVNFATSGTGYVVPTPPSGASTTSVTGSGTGMTVTYTVVGVVQGDTAVAPVFGGTGYAVGDTGTIDGGNGAATYTIASVWTDQYNKFTPEDNPGEVATVNFATSGTGYVVPTPPSGASTTSVTGSGTGMTVTYTVVGVVQGDTAVAPVFGGTGYAVGDTGTIDGGNGAATYTIASVYNKFIWSIRYIIDHSVYEGEVFSFPELDSTQPLFVPPSNTVVYAVKYIPGTVPIQDIGALKGSNGYYAQSDYIGPGYGSGSPILKLDNNGSGFFQTRWRRSSFLTRDQRTGYGPLIWTLIIENISGEFSKWENTKLSGDPLDVEGDYILINFGETYGRFEVRSQRLDRFVKFFNKATIESSTYITKANIWGNRYPIDNKKLYD